MTDRADADRSADLAAFSPMGAVLGPPCGAEATHDDLERVLDDLERRWGRDAVILL